MLRRWVVGVAVLARSVVAAAALAAAPSTHVIQISVDGLRGDLLAAMLAASPPTDLPSFRRFVTEGATTFDARSDFTDTITLPNHTCMLTGRPVRQPPGQPAGVAHGYTANGTPAANVTLHDPGTGHWRYIASVFDVAHDAGMSTRLYATKRKFVLFEQSYDAAHGAADSVAPDFGRDKIDRCLIASAEGDSARSATMQAALLADLRSASPDYVFVHYLDPDAAGHDHGWESPEWRQAVRNVDHYLGEIFALVGADSAFAGRTAILLTADHGGSGRNHGLSELAADYTIPFLCWGRGVKPGADLYALNRETRADPGAGRPGYDVLPQPIRNGDAANLALALLGLGPVPGSTINPRQELRLQDVPVDAIVPSVPVVH
jgi:hypothetical protein